MSPPNFDNDTEAGSDRPSGCVSDASLRTWLAAVAAVNPNSRLRLRNPMALRSAILLIAATPATRRSEFAAEILRRKRARQPSPAPAV